MTDYCIVIPARWNSSRFPGKPLAKILGKEMILHVYEKCAQVAENNHIYIATDNDKIESLCNKHNINVLRVNKQCRTGTDRVYLALNALKHNYQYVVIVQGDEPIIDPNSILAVTKKLNNQAVINCAHALSSLEELHSRSIPKLVTDNNNKLLYMSRNNIPASKSANMDSLENTKKQICIYGVPTKLLTLFGETDPTPLEIIEDIEILRFLEMGIHVQMIDLDTYSIAVDFESDIIAVENYINNNEVKINA